MKTEKYIVTFSNRGGALDSQIVTAPADEIEQASGQMVMEMIRQAGCHLCDGDTITIRRVIAEY